jgi:hypothetical protein
MPLLRIDLVISVGSGGYTGYEDTQAGDLTRKEGKARFGSFNLREMAGWTFEGHKIRIFLLLRI